MFEIKLNWITGVSLGLEFIPPAEIDEDLTFCMVVDLLIVRLQFLNWKKDSEWL